MSDAKHKVVELGKPHLAPSYVYSIQKAKEIKDIYLFY